jgi:hypothetical protein
MPVECSHCKTLQDVGTAFSGREKFSGGGLQTLLCINASCKREFDVLIPEQVLAGPFPHAAPPAFVPFEA